MRPDQWVPQLTEGETHAQTWASDPPLGTAEALTLLRGGELEVVGRVRDASNVVLYCSIALPGEVTAEHHVAYKPIRGERPLDDFPAGSLANREEAAWWVSEALGWSVVPPTIVRDGPAGPGAVQLWIETDEYVDALRMILVRDDRLRPMALFDALVNNADRKGGHLLVTTEGRVHGVDHGICFATEPKLRTVLWGWRGEPLTDKERADLERLDEALAGGAGRPAGPAAQPAGGGGAAARARRLLADGRLPLPDPYGHIIPWPPF